MYVKFAYQVINKLSIKCLFQPHELSHIIKMIQISDLNYVDSFA